MESVLNKRQKQALGKALIAAGYRPGDFVYSEVPEGESTYARVTLAHRTTKDVFHINLRKDGYYSINRSVPGVNREVKESPLTWPTVIGELQGWAQEVKQESEAVDPWEQEAEEMAEDDSYFSFAELPRVDQAIDESLEELKQKALEHGVKLGRIEAELSEAKKILKKSARNDTKKEWLSIFKAIIVEKLIDWGMQTELLQHVLRTLINSAHDVAHLAAHAARMLPG